MTVTRGEIRGNWETEQTTQQPSNLVHAELIEMVYRGRQHYPHSVVSENLRFFRYDPEPYEEESGADGYATDDEYEGDEYDDSEEESDEEFDDEPYEGEE
jgi:hypothetical protein